MAEGLPKALTRLGHDVRLVLPCYSAVDKATLELKNAFLQMSVLQHGKGYATRVWESALQGGVKVYLLENEEFFHRRSVYGEKDDLDRFLFFSRAALELTEAVGWRPQLFHCNDWHAGFLPAMLHGFNKAGGRDQPASLLTIHNIAYQGQFSQEWADQRGVSRHITDIQKNMHSLLWNALALGIYYSDAINTVSETYAREILTPEMGHGLAPLLNQRQRDLMGIINGLDYDRFNSSIDPYIPYQYDVYSLDRKQGNKLALQKRMGLEEDPALPMVTNVGRLAEMKGVDVMLGAVERLLQNSDRLEFALLGTGEAYLEQQARELAQRYPRMVGVAIEFDTELAQLFYAGSDIFLMPSRFEPCGLGQLIAMRYGTVPVAHRTGGLADTVKDGHTGFLFDGFNIEELSHALQRALSTWGDRVSWRSLMINAMAQDFSWDKAAARYEEAYRLAIAIHDEGRCRRAI